MNGMRVSLPRPKYNLEPGERASAPLLLPSTLLSEPSSFLHLHTKREGKCPFNTVEFVWRTRHSLSPPRDSRPPEASRPFFLSLQVLYHGRHGFVTDVRWVLAQP